jgi:hypothetical protein
MGLFQIVDCLGILSYLVNEGVGDVGKTSKAHMQIPVLQDHAQ